MSTSTDYTALRQAAGAYQRASHVYALRGAGREALLSQFIARPTEFVQPGSVIDSLVLDDSGHPVDFVLAIMDEGRTLLLSEQERTELSQIAAFAHSLGLTDVTVEELPSWGAVAVEGPRAWQVVQHLLDDDIAGLLLNEWRPIELVGAGEAFLARTGTTAEYGYLIVADVPAADIFTTLNDPLLDAGGSLVGQEGLLRARLEVNHPVLPDQFAGITVVEAGAGWMAGIDRTDAYRGATEFEAPTRRSIAVRSEHALVSGTTVEADGRVIGTIQVSAPAVDGETAYALALVDSPFDVPGLDLQADSAPVRTVSRPAVQPVSWIETIG